MLFFRNLNMFFRKNFILLGQKQKQNKYLSSYKFYPVVLLN